MDEEDFLEGYRAIEAASASASHYDDHRCIDIRKIWEARSAGLPDPEWPLAPKPKPIRRTINRNTGADFSHRLTPADIAFIQSSKEPPTRIAKQLGVVEATVRYHLARRPKE